MFPMLKRQRSKKNIKNIEKELLPKHIGIIMDGNGRWAKKRKMPRNMGHSNGAKKFEEIASYCNKIGIKYATFYAFSTENWKRPEQEVKAIMSLLKHYLNRVIDEVATQNIRLRFIGDLSVFTGELKELIDTAEKITLNKTGLVVNVAINYGGQAEIVNAVKRISRGVAKGEIDIDSVTSDTVKDNLYTAGQPDVDLVIRTSGEYRISNFLIWQSAYAEYFFTKTLWPDFTCDELDYILYDYSKRNRRYGGV